MSAKSKGPRVEDLWTKLDSILNESEDEVTETTLLFVGDSQCGKTTIIQGFLKPTVSKEPKPTFALEYCFARRKHPTNPNAPKSVSHIWELGGDMYEPNLVEIPISIRNIAVSTIVICCDLCKPQNVFPTLMRWITLIREIVAKKVKELQVADATLLSKLKEISAAAYAENVDKARVNPCLVPIVIVCNKFDNFKNHGIAERRALLQALRFLAHYHGATLMCTSSMESGLRDAVRNLIGTLCFRSPPKIACDIAPEKPFYVTPGKDSFESILLGGSKTGDNYNSSESKGAGAAANSRLASSESDLGFFIASEGVTRDCWKRITEHLETVLGAADLVLGQGREDMKGGGGNDNLDQGGGSGGGGDTETSNEFPEPEVDEVRAQRDAALLRYIQESERREAMMARMNADADANNSNANNDNDDEDVRPNKEREGGGGRRNNR